MKKLLESDTIKQLKVIFFIPVLLLCLFFINEFYEQQKDLIKAQNKTNLKIEVYILKMDGLEERIKSQESLTKQFYKWQLDKHASKNEDYEEDN